MAQETLIPARLQEIITDFAESDRGEKLQLLLEFSDRMPEIPQWLQDQHDRMDHVPECMTPTYIFAEKHGDGLRFFFDIPAEAPTVRGFASVLAEGLDGLTPQQVLQTPSDFFYNMGLQSALSPQRLNGISALIGHIKRLAVKHLQ
jgi:cysteine desulfuration protein SufE